MLMTTNGFEVAITLNVAGKQLSILTAFGTTPSLTLNEYIILPEQQRVARVEAFYQWVKSTYGVDAKANLLRGSEDRRQADRCAVADRYRLDLSSNSGTTQGSGYYAYLEQVPIKVTPGDPLRKFSGWYDPDEGVNISHSEETTVAVLRDTTLEAFYFERDWFTVEVEADSATAGDYGKVEGGGRVEYGSSVYIRAYSSNPTYRFYHWLDKDTNEVVSSDAELSYSPAKHVTLVAVFGSAEVQDVEIIVYWEIDRNLNGNLCAKLNPAATSAHQTPKSDVVIYLRNAIVTDLIVFKKGMYGHTWWYTNLHPAVLNMYVDQVLPQSDTFYRYHVVRGEDKKPW